MERVHCKSKCMGIICCKPKYMGIIYYKPKYMGMICSELKCFGKVCFKTDYFEKEYSQIPILGPWEPILDHLQNRNAEQTRVRGHTLPRILF